MLSKLNSFGLKVTSVEVVSEPTVITASPPPPQLFPPPTLTVEDFKKAFVRRLQRGVKCKNTNNIFDISVVSLIPSVLCLVVLNAAFIKLVISILRGENEEIYTDRYGLNANEPYKYTQVQSSRIFSSMSQRTIPIGMSPFSSTQRLRPKYR